MFVYMGVKYLFLCHLTVILGKKSNCSTLALPLTPHIHTSTYIHMYVYTCICGHGHGYENNTGINRATA